MAIKRKNKVRSVNSLENRDRAFAVLIVFLVVVIVAAPIVLFIFNPFGWDFGQNTQPTPTPTPEVTENRINVDGKKLIKSTSAITDSGDYRVFTEDYSENGYNFSIGFATDTGGDVSIGAASNPTYLFRVNDTEEEYNVFVGVNVTDGKTTIDEVDVYLKDNTKLTNGTPEVYDASKSYWFNKLTNLTEIKYISFTYTVK